MVVGFSKPGWTDLFRQGNLRDFTSWIYWLPYSKVLDLFWNLVHSSLAMLKLWLLRFFTPEALDVLWHSHTRHLCNWRTWQGQVSYVSITAMSAFCNYSISRNVSTNWHMLAKMFYWNLSSSFSVIPFQTWNTSR